MTTARSIPAFSVNCYGSDPRADVPKDDCWTGEDYHTLAEAQAAFDKWETEFPHSVKDTVYVQLLGPNGLEETKLVKSDAELALMAAEAAAYERSCQRERAQQAGMGLGIGAYNEEMGWDVGLDD